MHCLLASVSKLTLELPKEWRSDLEVTSMSSLVMRRPKKYVGLECTVS